MPTGRGFELFGGAKIKSVQYGVLSGVGDVAISPIDVSKSVLLFSYSINNDSTVYRLIKGRIINATTINFSRYQASSNPCYIAWYVVEFEGNILVQMGESNIVGGSDTVNVTISPVDLNKSFVVVSNSTDYDTMFDVPRVYGYLTSSTNLSLKRTTTWETSYVAWQVITFL